MQHEIQNVNIDVDMLLACRSQKNCYSLKSIETSIVIISIPNIDRL